MIPLSVLPPLNTLDFPHLTSTKPIFPILPLPAMKKFGFSKKGGDEGDDASRSALFGRKSKSPAPGNDNPYAQAPAGGDPYAQDANKFAGMTPYQQARAGAPPVGGAPAGLPGGPRAGAGYGAPPQSAGGYGNDKYGAAGGYGANRYDDNQNAYGANQRSGAAGARGPGGYGGLGRTNSNSTDAVRDELFSGAQDRYQQNKPQAGGYGQSAPSGADGGYGGYGASRELTAEEQEAEEYRATKQQIKDVRNESVQTVQRSVQRLAQMEEMAGGSLARLGAQGERLHNTERNMDMAANHNKVAEDRAKELKTLNRSMFAVHVGNPFTSKARAAERDAAVLERHRQEREVREATRQEAFKSNQRMEETFREMTLSGRPQRGAGGQRSQAEKSRFEIDESDDEAAAEAQEAERQIEEGIDAMAAATGRLNMVSHALGKEIDNQNGLIASIGKKSDAVDDGVRMNRERLNRIK
ncbi:hypothetical protein CORC01_03399 [Colletotrichum orchidophilum]|uniref:t-SNARE coiled-coil homology domain-containing protein n=1 Tax=Colletotrichum orchidophilum TaxID=1209926 RepID=A0A1G4BJ78_9PEZI|nr:uncharacterized protein CORC01_03399 [Colletotrichum orchidophilum]OHF01366.1 hypothetical protein CORC01_03399 [Colletotrichum orchidophilum]